jgi:hypothetical protein
MDCTETASGDLSLPPESQEIVSMQRQSLAALGRSHKDSRQPTLVNSRGECKLTPAGLAILLSVSLP